MSAVSEGSAGAVPCNVAMLISAPRTAFDSSVVQVGGLIIGLVSILSFAATKVGPPIAWWPRIRLWRPGARINRAPALFRGIFANRHRGANGPVADEPRLLRKAFR